MSVKLLLKRATPIVGAGLLIISLPAAAASDGEKVFNHTCRMCHGTGMMGAPKFGNKEAWADRIAKGKDTLYDHAINGFGKMRPKGGKKSLSDDEVKAAVDYMVNAVK
jgi:cytochrome c5